MHSATLGYHPPVRILVDDAVAAAESAFAPLGDVALRPAVDIDAGAVAGFDALVVRSGVRVDRRLIAGSRLRFVGTATAGADHIDEPALRDAGIAFASAPGCNAQAVADYVAAALVHLAARSGQSWAGRTIGIVGVGHVGRRVVRVAEALQMRVLRCDPPLARRGDRHDFVDFTAILRESDVISLHVPLTTEGPDATSRMLSADVLARARPGAVLINTSRGDVADNRALATPRRAGQLSGLVVDVWQGEPRVDVDLLGAADLMTPHIAGYSWMGRVRGTWAIAEALATFLGVAPSALPPPPKPTPAIVDGLSLVSATRRDFGVDSRAGVASSSLQAASVIRDLAAILCRGYDILADDASLRSLADHFGPGANIAGLRRNYQDRPEFSELAVSLPAGGHWAILAGTLDALGLPVARIAEDDERT